jgi:hypothetical protein
MIDADLKSVAATLSAAISRRVDLADSEDMALLVDQHLHVQVLRNYREQLEGLEGADAFAWLLRRMAEIETRVLALQAATLAGAPGLAPADVAAPAAAPGPAAPGPAAPGPAAAPASVPAAWPVEPDFTQPKSATVLFDDEAVQTGFYPAETAPDGSMFRWLGPAPQASVFLPKAQLPVKVTITVHSAFVPEAIGDVRIALDGGDWVRVTAERFRNGYVLLARPPAGPITHAGTMRLDIDAVRTASPSARGEQDTRDLAIAISRIEIATI